jgi:putative ABC transport system permease protein
MNIFKTAIRVHNRYRWFTLVNIIGLSIGLTCSVIIFLYISFHSNTDTHHADADRIFRVVLDIKTPDGKIEHEPGSSLPMAGALKNDYSQVEATGFCMKFYSSPVVSIESNGNKANFREENTVAYADAGFLTLFDNEMVVGNNTTALTTVNSAVLSEHYALKYFGTREVIGKYITINNTTTLEVTGVIRYKQNNSHLAFDVLVSLPTLKVINPKYQDENFTWIGSNNWTFLKMTSVSDARSLDPQLPAFTKKFLGEQFVHWRFQLQPLSQMHFDTRYDGVINKTLLYVLGIAAVGLLAIVCINYINLTIAQSAHRTKEIGVRRFLGGSRIQLISQLMAETTLMVAGGTLLALFTTSLILPVVNSWLGTSLSPVQFITTEMLIKGSAFIVALIIIAGYYPAVILSGFSGARAMNGKNQTPHSAQVFKHALIGFQYAVATIFLIGTFAILNQVDFLLTSDLGFQKDEIVTVRVPRSSFQRMETFRNSVSQLPGVRAASLHNQAPMSESTDGGFIKFDNRNNWEAFLVRDRWADEKYLETYSLDLVAGRNIILRDSLTEVIVNETLLTELGIADPEDALTKSILFDNSGLTGTIVGVVRDFHHRSLQGTIEPLAIYPLPGVFNHIGISLPSGTNSNALSIENVWKDHFPDDIFSLSYLDQSIAGMYEIEEVTGKIMQVFAVVACIICLIGILGLSAFSAAERTKEIGIRKVLGASSVNIVVMLSQRYLVLIVISFAFATPSTFWILTRWLDGFAYHISLSWSLFAIPIVFIAGVTLLLVGGYTFKVASTNPTQSLKHE